MRNKPKAERPETMSETRTWDVTKNHYKRDGLCHRCASQAAWGHQIGFSRLEHAPCSDCAAVVATFPVEASHPAWRRHRQGKRRP